MLAIGGLSLGLKECLWSKKQRAQRNRATPNHPWETIRRIIRGTGAVALEEVGNASNRCPKITIEWQSHEFRQVSATRARLAMTGVKAFRIWAVPIGKRPLVTRNSFPTLYWAKPFNSFVKWNNSDGSRKRTSSQDQRVSAPIAYR